MRTTVKKALRANSKRAHRANPRAPGLRDPREEKLQKEPIGPTRAPPGSGILVLKKKKEDNCTPESHPAPGS